MTNVKQVVLRFTSQCVLPGCFLCLCGFKLGFENDRWYGYLTYGKTDVDTFLWIHTFFLNVKLDSELLCETNLFYFNKQVCP